MEQYIHTLIAADSGFVPAPIQVMRFFDFLVTALNFHLVAVNNQYVPGPVVRKPTSFFRTFTNSFTGETQSIPRLSLERPEKISEIGRFIDGSTHYTVELPGEWGSEDRPVLLLTTDKRPFDGAYQCSVRCELRPEPVSTSAWDVEAGPNLRNVPSFGSSCEPDLKTGIFPNPWTGQVIEVEGAGCARFWIEFEFGRFIYPEVTDTLQVFSPSVISKAEECFKTRFVQGCRFW